jgi:hypothetical protein
MVHSKTQSPFTFFPLRRKENEIKMDSTVLSKSLKLIRFEIKKHI